MPRREKERGRPMKRGYPPRIDATPKQLVQAMFSTSPNSTIEEREYKCSDCGRGVYFPEIFHNDNRCSECHTAARV